MSVAPDLVRGAALLGVALATVPAWLYGRPTGPGGRPIGEPDGEGTATADLTADRIADAVGIAVVDGRMLPLFALLLGWGAARVLARERVAGRGPARRLVLRRAAVLLAVGAAVALLLDGRNVLGVYAVALVPVIWLDRASRAAVVVVATVVAVPGLVIAGFGRGTGGAESVMPGPSPSYPLAAAERLGDWVVTVALTPVLGGAVVGAALLGVLVARTTWLDDPARHRRRLAVVGGALVVVGLAGGVPLAVAAWGATGGTADLGAAWAGVLHAVTGLAGAVGAVGLLAWAASFVPADGRRSGVVGLIATAGALPLTAYVGQLVVFAVLLPPWSAGLGGAVGSSAAAGIAVLAWLLAAVAVTAWVRAGRGAGPLERLLRVGEGAQPSTDRQGLVRSSVT